MLAMVEGPPVLLGPPIPDSLSGSRTIARMASLRHRRAFAQVEVYCMFIGYPRSGHSLLASMLDAHPDAVIAHELDALGYVEQGWSRGELFAWILRHDRDFTAEGRNWYGYNYTVPGQWQGRYRALRVIGDKKAAVSTERIARDPLLLERLQRLVGLPVRLLHVVRNPFDNIATMMRRGGISFESAAGRYFALCSTISDIRGRTADVFDLRHEDFLANLPDHLGQVTRWLGLEPSREYLAACGEIAFDSPRRTRGEVSWSDDQIQRVMTCIGDHDFLAAYSSDQP